MPSLIAATEPKLTTLDRLIGWWSPGAGLRRYFDRMRLTRAYEAASPRDPWKPRRPGASAEADHQADAATLRAKSRALKQNVPYIRAGLEARVSHAVGTGITPTFKGRHGDKLNALWKRWAPQADADGARDVYGIQGTSYEAVDVDGECLLRIRPRRGADGLPVPVQFQLLEVDWLDTRLTRAEGANTIINGIEYDPLGRKVAFWLFDQHPGDAVLKRGTRLTSKRVPADQIIHVFRPERPGQGRGFPRLAPVISRVRDLQLLEDAEIARKNLEARLSVLASGDVSQMAEPPQGLGAAHAPNDLGQLPSGGITQVAPGVNLTVVEPKAAPGFVDYVGLNLHLICAGGGFTYEQATGILTDTNFSSARVGQQNQRREIERDQWLMLIPQLCERMARVFIDYCILAGHVPTSAQDDTTIEHNTPKWNYVNPVQDVGADLDEIAGGLNSFSAVIRRRGDDPQAVFSQLEQDIKDLQGRGIWDALVMLLKGKAPPTQPSA